MRWPMLRYSLEAKKSNVDLGSITCSCFFVLEAAHMYNGHDSK